MVVDAYVLPAPGDAPGARSRARGVIFWQRPRRNAGRAAGARLAVYAPSDLSPGELAELRAGLLASIGDALAGTRSAEPRALAVLWWLLGAAVAALLALRALEFGPAYSWLALLVVLATLPPIRSALAALRDPRPAVAAVLARRFGELEVGMGEDQRARERVAALWQVARRQRGSGDEALQALESQCVEQSWPAAARVYAGWRGAAAGPRTALDRLLRRPARLSGGASSYVVVDMRAWP